MREGMHPGRAPWLHHLLQGGMCQSLCLTGDIQRVSGVWLDSFPLFRKLVQVLTLAAFQRRGTFNTAEVRFDNEEVPAENLPEDSEKASRWQWSSLKRVKWCGGLAVGMRWL